MMVRMLCNSGRLKQGRWYRVDEEGPDWYRIGKVYISKDFATTESLLKERERRWRIARVVERNE